MENNRYREEEKELEENGVVSETPIEETEVLEELDEKKEVKETKSTKKFKKQLEELENEKNALVEQVALLKDQLLRNQAELENFKRRTNEERIKERKYAMQDFFSEVIDVIDVFDKAVSVKTEDEKLRKFLSGFGMVNLRLKQTLENYGVKKIDALNQPFDPTYHQAMETIEVEGAEPNIVVEVVIEGYVYKDRILRPSMVKVSK